MLLDLIHDPVFSDAGSSILFALAAIVPVDAVGRNDFHRKVRWAFDEPAVNQVQAIRPDESEIRLRAVHVANPKGDSRSVHLAQALSPGVPIHQGAQPHKQLVGVRVVR